MQHDRQDAYNAGARNRSRDPREWHPILAATEIEPGLWELRGQYRAYAVIRMLRLGGELGYRATTGEERPEDRQLVGYYTSLRAACWHAHAHHLARQARAGGVNGR